jgi:hypothetical protein
MRVFYSSGKNVYIAIRDNNQVVLIDKNNQWYFENYKFAKLVSELLKVKF